MPWARSGAVIAVLAVLLVAPAGVAVARTSNAAATHPFFVEGTSNQSFDQTVSALKRAVSRNGMMVMGSLNQQRALSMTGLSLRGAEAYFVGVQGKDTMMLRTQTRPRAGEFRRQVRSLSRLRWAAGRSLSVTMVELRRRSWLSLVRP